MPIPITCVCGRNYTVSEEMVGRPVQCKCGHAMIVELGFAPESIRKIDRSLIGSQNTVAGNPGLLKVSLVRFCRIFPFVGYISAGALVLSLAAFPFFGWRALLFAVGAVYVPFAVISKYKQKFHAGDRVATVVISNSPWLIALYTDLSTGRSGPKPAIFIKECPALARIPEGAPSVGQRLVAITQYFGNGKNEAWDDISPTVAELACSDHEGIAAAIQSIDPEDWRVLDNAIAQLPAEVGKYPLG
jgi:hypothetical protein